jgi:hypothetical protein
LNNARKDIAAALETGYIKLANDPEPKPKRKFTQADIDQAYLEGHTAGYEDGYNEGYTVGRYRN